MVKRQVYALIYALIDADIINNSQQPSQCLTYKNNKTMGRPNKGTGTVGPKRPDANNGGKTDGDGNDSLFGLRRSEI